MQQFFSDCLNFFKTVAEFIKTIVDSIANFFLMAGKVKTFIQSVTSLLPAFIVPFILIGITVLIVMFVLDEI